VVLSRARVQPQPRPVPAARSRGIFRRSQPVRLCRQRSGQLHRPERNSGAEPDQHHRHRHSHKFGRGWRNGGGNLRRGLGRLHRPKPEHATADRRRSLPNGSAKLRSGTGDHRHGAAHNSPRRATSFFPICETAHYFSAVRAVSEEPKAPARARLGMEREWASWKQSRKLGKSSHW
jgi:hypothetical protein